MEIEQQAGVEEKASSLRIFDVWVKNGNDIAPKDELICCFLWIIWCSFVSPQSADGEGEGGFHLRIITSTAVCYSLFINKVNLEKTARNFFLFRFINKIKVSLSWQVSCFDKIVALLLLVDDS